MNRVAEEQRRWLADELDKKGWGAKSALAAHLGVRNDAITRILTERNGRTYREISFEELVKMADFFNSTPPGLGSLITKEGDEIASTNKSKTEQNLVEMFGTFPSSAEHNTTRSGPATIVPQAELVGARDLPV